MVRVRRSGAKDVKPVRGLHNARVCAHHHLRQRASALSGRKTTGAASNLFHMHPPLRRLLLALLVLSVVVTPLPAAAGPASAEEDLARWVDPRIGTAPVGFVVPGAVRPHGMVQVSPDTEGPFAYSG